MHRSYCLEKKKNFLMFHSLTNQRLIYVLDRTIPKQPICNKHETIECIFMQYLKFSRIDVKLNTNDVELSNWQLLG